MAIDKAKMEELEQKWRPTVARLAPKLKGLRGRVVIPFGGLPDEIPVLMDMLAAQGVDVSRVDLQQVCSTVTDPGGEMLDKLDRIRAENDTLRSLLREVEWRGIDGTCPLCGADVPSPHGNAYAGAHTPFCRLAAALK